MNLFSTWRSMLAGCRLQSSGAAGGSAAGTRVPDGLPQRLQLRADGHAQATAYLQKRHGVWHRWTWARVHAAVESLAGAFRAAGLQDGEAVGVASGARVEAVLAVLACQRAGLVPVLLSPNLPAGGLARQAEQARLCALVLEDQEQVDKVADVQSRLPGLRRSWVVDPKGTRTYTHIGVEPIAPLLEQGGPALPAPTGAATACAVALFSAGVFDEPRLVQVGPAALVALGAACHRLGLREGERCASVFGLADPLGHFFAVAAPVLAGTVACFGEGRVPTVPELRECAPSAVAIPARLLDRLRRETEARASRSGGWRRALVQRWSRAAAPGPLLQALVARPIAAALGLAACRSVFTGYERMAPASARFLARLGIAGQGLYGLAEAAGPAGAFARAEEPVLALFEGYPGEVGPDRTLSVQVEGSRVPTGDLVSLEGGLLHVVGRAADLLTLPDGSLLSPSAIEAELMASPYIHQAVAVGGPALGIAVLVELDEVTLREWARSHGLAFTTLRSFADSTEVQRLVEQAVGEANQRLAPAARIVHTVVLPRTLDAANGELTPALALRRAIVRNRYAHRLAALAADAASRRTPS